MKSSGYRQGTPSLKEWEGLWRHSEGEASASIEECRKSTDSLWSHLEKNYRVGSGDWDDLFLRGDFLGDRSQTLEIVYPPALKPELFEYLSAWVGQTRPKWRIIIPTFLGHLESFVVYPEGIRHGKVLSMPSQSSCQQAAAKMLALDSFTHARARAVEDGWIAPNQQKRTRR